MNTRLVQLILEKEKEKLTKIVDNYHDMIHIYIQRVYHKNIIQQIIKPFKRDKNWKYLLMYTRVYREYRNILRAL